jgi:murein DD-endopeptidase MepM/ murein hydrolase activator NlpD
LSGLALLTVIAWEMAGHDHRAAETTPDMHAALSADTAPSQPVAGTTGRGTTGAPDTPAAPSQPEGATTDRPAADVQGPAASPAPAPSPVASRRDPDIGGPSAERPDATADEPSTTDTYETVVRLDKGDTLAGVLGELGFAPREVGNAIAALAPHLKLKRLPIGQAMTLEIQAPAEANTPAVLQSLVVRPEARREVALRRGADGTFDVQEKQFEVTPKLVRAAGAVDGSLIASADQAGVPRAALAEMLRAFSWDVNFQHDMKVGDRFAVLIEQSWTVDGKLVDPGHVLWAELTTGAGRQTYSVYRFKPRGGAAFFYDRKGQSVIRALLRTPLNLSRISSRFGMRRHPILGFTRMHTGIDFAAPPGTPVLAAGAGRVVQAGRKGGYGNWVEIYHGGGLATGYAHMLRIARGIRPGARVRQSQVIGFVGSTGLSTGPHLHFELHRNGRPVNPLTVARTALRARLAGKELARFKSIVADMDRARDGATVIDRQ